MTTSHTYIVRTQEAGVVKLRYLLVTPYMIGIQHGVLLPGHPKGKRHKLILPVEHQGGGHEG